MPVLVVNEVIIHLTNYLCFIMNGVGCLEARIYLSNIIITSFASLFHFLIYLIQFVFP